jgi:kumamolisin
MPSSVKKIGGAVLAAALAVCWSTAALAADAPKVTLRGHVPPQLRRSTLLGPAPSDENVSLVLAVRVDPDLMAKTLDGLFGPSAPKRKKFLGKTEFSRRFDLAAKRQKLKEFAVRAGLVVDAASDDPGSLAIKVSGSAAAVERAFGVRLNRYRAPDGQVFRAHETEPTVPAELAPHISAVLGLSNFRGAHKPRLARALGQRHVIAAPAGSASGAAASGNALTGGTGPACYNGTPPLTCGLAPADIKTLYGLTGGSVPTGAGQTVALLELDGYAPSDISLYETNTHIFSQPGPTPTITCTSQDGACGGCGPNQTDACNATTLAGGQSDEGGTSDGGMIEVALDIDMVIALAPSASILVYTALNADADLYAAYAKIASDDLAPVASTSWGTDEEDSGGAFMASENAVFQQMAVNGQGIFSAAGDSGAYDASGVTISAGSSQLVAWAGNVITDDPASQPYVTAVGGTSLNGTLASHTETVWNEGCNSGSSPGTNCQANGAGGGGVANYCEVSGAAASCATPGAVAYWPLPSYQSGVSGTYSQTYRNIPDVTLNADPDTSPYSICVGATCVSDNTLIGGTSAASPLWAALTALINQQRASGGYEYVGFANPAIYQLAQGSSYSTTFNDVTSGNNGSVYSAGSGYDNVSGWGSFKGSALINALKTPLASNLPVTGLTATTLSGSSIQYTWDVISGNTYNVYYATNSAQVLAVNTLPPFTQTGLLGDQTSGIEVFSEIAGVLGTNPSFITTATYAGAPSAAPSATGWSSSATFTFSACAAPPGSTSCSGYMVQVSPNASFTGTVFSSSTPNRALTTLSVTGLAASTGYFMRLANLNVDGGPSYGPTGGVNTGSNLVAPVSPAYSSISTGSIVFAWGQSTNPNGITYLAQASTMANLSGTLFTQSGAALHEDFTGLSADASYYFQVSGLGGPALNAGPQATLAAAPVAAPVAFSAVGASGLTAAWSTGLDQSDTLYQADVSASPTFASGVTSVQSRTTSATFGGLSPNTLYYARVKAIGRAGGSTAETALGSTITLVNAPTLPAQPFSGQTTTGFTFSFNQAGNPAGTNYVVQIATSAGFTTITSGANTTGASASFSGLLSNQIYFAQVASLNSTGSPSAFATASTATAVAAPSPAGVPVATVTVSGLGYNWTLGAQAAGTGYSAQVSVNPTFIPVAATSATANAFATLTGLQANTTYYGEVQAVSLNPPNPNGAFLALPTLATLASPPAAAAGPAFLQVSYTSATVAWTALPLIPQNAAAEGYLVQFDTAPDFSGVAVTSSVAPGAASAVVTGLNFATTYYARVGSLNWEGLPNYLTLGTTATVTPALSSGTVGAGGVVLTVPKTYAQISSMTVVVPAGAFPAGTPISAVANLAPLPASVTNEASSIVPFGTNVGIVLSANGLQPNSPVTISMPYDFTQVPAGQSESHLSLWRYDPTSGQWTLVPSQVDTVGHVLNAQTQHFSTFSPFFVAAGSDVGSVQVWPQPWEIGDASSQYFASALTFANLPGGATVKIFTIVGELVWSGTAAADGTLNWNGNNKYGRHAASGTYYATFQNGGQTKTRRLVIIR